MDATSWMLGWAFGLLLLVLVIFGIAAFVMYLRRGHR
jgi:hypothetical protein